MRMDNETYRLKVENMFSLLAEKDGSWKPEVLTELEHLALAARKGRYFLRVVGTQPRTFQIHFYRYYMSRARREDSIVDLERQIRHMFYETREEAKEILAELVDSSTLPALFQVIALTEEGWLAGELIRIVLGAPIDQLRQPITQHLYSPTYLLQCLAIYLIGKLGDEDLLEALVEFYRKPEGEKIDRLEKKAYDALIEGGSMASPRLILRWLKDKNSRVREIGLTLASERQIPEAVSDLVGLVLVDAKTRARAAAVLLEYEQAGVLSWHKDDERSLGVQRIINGAKEAPLIATLRSMLLREDNSAVREVVVNLTRLAPESNELSSQLRRLVNEDNSSGVQIAAMHALADVDRGRMKRALIELFSADAPNREVIEAANEIMDTLPASEVRQIKQGVRTRMERRKAALDKFAASVEWWRHDT